MNQYLNGLKRKRNAKKILEKEDLMVESEVEKDMKPINFVLWDLEKEFEQRKLILEKKLLELHRLKHQESYIFQMRKNLEEKMKEIDMLNTTINLLQAERNDLQREIKEGFLAEKELEMAKKKIEKMQRKMDANEKDHLKGKLTMLQEKVFGLGNIEFDQRDTLIKEKIKGLKDVELEIFEMRRKNKELELEKRELAVKLVASQAKLISLSNNLTERKIIAQFEEELSNLKQANEDFLNQVERLQKNRFDVVEELVYQRWLNTCLRFEIQNYPILSRKDSEWDAIGTKSNQKPHEKSKQLMLDYSISSQTSLTESEKTDSSTTESSCSISQGSNIDEKYSLIHDIKKWGRNKDDIKGKLSTRNGVIRKRLSFTDSSGTVISAFQDKQESVEGVMDDKETSIHTSPNSEVELAKEKHEFSLPEISAKKEIVESKLDERKESAESEAEELFSKIPNSVSTEHKVDIIVVFFIFCFISFLFLQVFAAAIH